MKKTKIQWCHSTVNPVMGCDGCELWPSTALMKDQIRIALRVVSERPDQEVTSRIEDIIQNRNTSEIYLAREEIANQLCAELDSGHSGIPMPSRQFLVGIIRAECKCYAGMLGTVRAGHKGYADAFDSPKLYPGRVAKAAQWGPPSAQEIIGKPWLKGLPRLIFVSDMGDALSKRVPFEFLNEEIIANVNSPAGQKHIWLWLSKRPGRMADFGAWLAGQGIVWPDNLVAMTTVTEQRFVRRADALRRVPSKWKALSLEPLCKPVAPDLSGIDWVIVGGGSDALANPFHVEWALRLRDKCCGTGTAFFLKQLGRWPFHLGQHLALRDKHGGDWSEWLSDWRVRKMPRAFYPSSGPDVSGVGEA